MSDRRTGSTWSSKGSQHFLLTCSVEVLQTKGRTKFIMFIRIHFTSEELTSLSLCGLAQTGLCLCLDVLKFIVLSVVL